MLLIGLLFMLLFATVLDVVLEGWAAFRLDALARNLILAAVFLLGLWLLKKGRLISVVWLVAGLIMLVAVESLWAGIAGRAASLLLFVAPITLVGLVAGRRALYLIASLSLSYVLIVFLLEVSGSPLLSTREPRSVADSVALFIIIVGLLVIFLDRFALTLQDALTKSAERERDLRDEVAERQRLETRLQLATDAAKIGLWTWDPDTNQVDWSPQMKELFGLPPDADVTLETFREGVHPEDRERAVRPFGEIERRENKPYRIVLPNGQVRWLVGHGRSIALPDGQRLALGAAYEVTALIEAEAKRIELLDLEQAARLKAERFAERLSFLAEAGQILAETLSYHDTLTRLAEMVVPRIADWCAIDVLNDGERLERVVVTHNDPGKAQFAYDIQRHYPTDPEAETGAYQVLNSGKPLFLEEVPDEWLVQVARDERHLDMLREVGFSSAIAAPLISRGKPLGVLTLVLAESGRRYDEDDLELAMQLAERAAIAVDNARLFAEAKSLNAELEERVEARTEELKAANTELESFTYSASHDLRAPLRGINGFSQALLEDYGDELDETAREYLRRIHAGAVRMGDLIDDLLALSRISRAEFTLERVDLTALVCGVLEILQAAEPEREVELRIEPYMYACADARLLLIALENLLGNAWKFTREEKNAVIEVGSEAEGKFFVRDNGAGFDMKYANKLFVPFQRLHPTEAYGGTGIGLATSRRIFERLGGRLWGEGVEGEGATFHFTLPLTVEASREPS